MVNQIFCNFFNFPTNRRCMRCMSITNNLYKCPGSEKSNSQKQQFFRTEGKIAIHVLGAYKSHRKELIMVERSIVEEKLRQKLEPDHLEITDMSDGCGAKYDVLIVSKLFEGKPLLARHRLVNEVLVEEMKLIHALTMKTLTPAQWNKP